MTAAPDIVVVGAGIVGASVAYHAARAGASVLLIEHGTPGCGVTGSSFAWIGEPGGADPVDASTALRRTALADYHRLEGELPDVGVRWTGSVSWGDGVPTHAEALAPHERMLTATELAELEPNVRQGPVMALHKRTDGALDAVAVTRALVEGARRAGATVRAAATVRGLTVEAGGVRIDTAAGALAAERVVLAAGTGTPALCAALGVDLPITASPALLFRFDAPPGLVRTLVSSPEVEVRQGADGHLLAAGAYAGEESDEDLRRSGDELGRRIRATFRGADDLHLVSAQIGWRPMPPDGLPVVGSLPGEPAVWVAVLHSAITLAPAVGRFLSHELVHGAPVAELRGLGPERFACSSDEPGAEDRQGATDGRRPAGPD